MLDFPRSGYKCIQQDIESCSHYGLILYGLNVLNILAMVHGDTVLWNKMSGFFSVAMQHGVILWILLAS